MIKLESSQYDSVHPLFAGLRLYPHLPFCVLEGRQPGRVLVDDPDSPRAAFVGHRIGYSYLGGESEPFAQWLETNLEAAMGLNSFDLCAASPF